MNAAATRPAPADQAACPPTTRTDLRRPRLVIAVLWTLVIMVLCWMPGRMVHQLEDGSHWFLFKIPSLDKLVHGGIFIVFAILWARLGTSRRRFTWIALAGLGLAVLTELVQKLSVIGRDGSFADGAIDFAGILVGIVAAPLVEPGARWIELRVFPETASRAVPTRGTTVIVEDAAGPAH